MKRWFVLLFGIGCYLLFHGVFLYAVGFVGGFGTPTTLDGAAELPLLGAMLVNAMLLVLFGLQHSVMARPRFKRWWTRLVPEGLERSVYVLATNLALAMLFWQWRPMGGVVWDVTGTTARIAVWGVFAVGWLTVLTTTFLINHFDLFGLRQVWFCFRRRPYTPLPFVTPGPYRYIRHPLYVGWLLAFWAAPTMTVAHLVFAAGITVYILIAVRLEERDLIRCHTGYNDYRRRVPMFVPRIMSLTRKAECVQESVVIE